MYKKISSHNWTHQIYISTAQIYGDKNLISNSELDVINPNNNYSILKKNCENLFLKKNATILRLSNVYGNNMPKNNVFSDIFRQIDKAEIVLNDIYPIRDYVFIDDVIQAIYLCILKKFRGILNIGTGVGYSVNELASFILNEVKKKNTLIKSRNSSNTNNTCLILNIAKAKKEIEWTPKIKLKTGIKKLMFK